MQTGHGSKLSRFTGILGSIAAGLLLILATAFTADTARAEGLRFSSQGDIEAVSAPKSAERTQRSPRRVARSSSSSSERKTASSSRSSSSSKSASRSRSGGGNVNWIASASCLDGSLKSAIYHVAANYGSVTVNSTCRSAAHNRRVGGAPRSKHLTGDAADIRIYGNVSGATAYLRSTVGGFKHYGGGLYHIDNGPRRSW
jgi:uncharacterized protein YcbK (DUF882 family)